MCPWQVKTRRAFRLMVLQACISFVLVPPTLPWGSFLVFSGLLFKLSLSQGEDFNKMFFFHPNQKINVNISIKKTKISLPIIHYKNDSQKASRYCNKFWLEIEHFVVTQLSKKSKSSWKSKWDMKDNLFAGSLGKCYIETGSLWNPVAKNFDMVFIWKAMMTYSCWTANYRWREISSWCLTQLQLRYKLSSEEKNILLLPSWEVFERNVFWIWI